MTSFNRFSEYCEQMGGGGGGRGGTGTDMQQFLMLDEWGNNEESFLG